MPIVFSTKEIPIDILNDLILEEIYVSPKNHLPST